MLIVGGLCASVLTVLSSLESMWRSVWWEPWHCQHLMQLWALCHRVTRLKTIQAEVVGSSSDTILLWGSIQKVEQWWRRCFDDLQATHVSVEVVETWTGLIETVALLCSSLTGCFVGSGTPLSWMPVLVDQWISRALNSVAPQTIPGSNMVVASSFSSSKEVMNCPEGSQFIDLNALKCCYMVSYQGRRHRSSWSGFHRNTFSQ